MLKPTTVDDLNKIYPQYSFVKEGGSIYCYDEDHSIIKVAECGYSDYFAFFSMTHKISPDHFKEIQTAIKQVLSAYIFFCYPFLEVQRRQLYLYMLQNLYCNRMVMSQQLVVNYVTKFHDETIYWSPEIQMGNDKFYLHLTNYNQINEFNITITDSVGRLLSLSITVDEINNNHSKLTHFFFDTMLQPYLGIEASELTLDHLKILEMIVI
jgi:hypothetical protein